VTASPAIAREHELVALPGVRPANDEQPTADEVLDVEDVARLLRVGRNTIYELVGRNEIPHRRLGKQIRFSRAVLMRWLDPWSSQGAKERQ
jgi:excisionase family DNA binding protein